MNYIANVFSLSMVPTGHLVSVDDILACDIPTVVSHVDNLVTAYLLSVILDRGIKFNPEPLTLRDMDTLFVVELMSFDKTFRPPDGLRICEEDIYEMEMSVKVRQLRILGNFEDAKEWK